MYFSRACCSNLYDVIILLLKAYDNLNLSYLHELDANADTLFNITMTRPFDITRDHFDGIEYTSPYSVKTNTNVYCKLDEYNDHVLAILKQFMCNDMADIVTEYSDI